MQDNNYQGKHVVITGGSRGIGAAISELLASKGAIIHIIFRSKIEEAKNLLEKLDGSGHSIHQIDLTNPADLEPLFDSFTHPIDLLINNAGIGFHHPLLDESFESWQSAWKSILEVNLTAIANTCYLAAKKMKDQESGRIINVSSRGAFRGEPLMPAYGASKAGLNSMTQSLAHYLAEYNIFVGAVAPGFVETDMSRPRIQGAVGAAIKAQSPLNRVAQPEEIAAAVYTLARAPMWMTGSIFDANGASYFRT